MSLTFSPFNGSSEFTCTITGPNGTVMTINGSDNITNLLERFGNFEMESVFLKDLKQLELSGRLFSKVSFAGKELFEYDLLLRKHTPLPHEIPKVYEYLNDSSQMRNPKVIPFIARDVLIHWKSHLDTKMTECFTKLKGDLFYSNKYVNFEFNTKVLKLLYQNKSESILELLKTTKLFKEDIDGLLRYFLENKSVSRRIVTCRMGTQIEEEFKKIFNDDAKFKDIYQTMSWR